MGGASLSRPYQRTAPRDWPLDRRDEATIFPFSQKLSPAPHLINYLRARPTPSTRVATSSLLVPSQRPDLLHPGPGTWWCHHQHRCQARGSSSHLSSAEPQRDFAVKRHTAQKGPISSACLLWAETQFSWGQSAYACCALSAVLPEVCPDVRNVGGLCPLCLLLAYGKNSIKK